MVNKTYSNGDKKYVRKNGGGSGIKEPTPHKPIPDILQTKKKSTLKARGKGEE